MKQKINFLIALLCFSASIWAADHANNIRVQQKDKDIIITYDLSKKSNVRLLISTDATGSNFTPLSSVEGDVGKNVRAGQNLQIVWHPLQEYKVFKANNVRFKVEALGSYESYALPKWMHGKSNMETLILADFGYSTIPQWSVGITLGQTYSGIGWFVSARSNFNFQSATNGWKCGKDGYVNDILPFYSGKAKSSQFVANAGFLLDLIDVLALSPNNRFHTFGFYIGAGYGQRTLFWETFDGAWIEHSPSSFKGVSSNIGLIGSVYGFTLKAGVNTIKFKYFEMEVGLGWMF